MWKFGLCLVILSGAFAIDYQDLNSHLHFANGLQDFLNVSGTVISTQCTLHLTLYIGALLSKDPKTFWAKQMFDAGAKFPSAMLEGNAGDLGSFDQCLNIKTDFQLAKEISGKYCLGILPVGVGGGDQSKIDFMSRNPYESSKIQPAIGGPQATIGIQLATCLPDGCSTADIQKLYHFFRIKMSFFDELCQTKASTGVELSGGSIATITFLGIILCLMVTSTAYDLVLYYTDRKSHHPVLIAFSMFTNGKKLLAISTNPNQISCLNGMRVISTMWVVYVHRFQIALYFPLTNYLELSEYITLSKNMYIASATIVVDTFFLMAGIVTAYTHMGAVSKKRKFNLVMFYVHRYLRLTPILAVIVLIHVTLLKHFGSGPLWPFNIQRDLIEGCERYWWKVLIYAQNHGSQINICIPQSWYLCVDMQVYLLVPILLIPLGKWPKYTLWFTGFLAFCSTLTAFLTGWFFEMNPGLLVPRTDPQAGIDFFIYYYMATQTRALPWLLGIILGYAYFQCRQRTTRLVLNKTLVVLLWLLSLALMVVCTFAGHDLMYGEYNKLGSSFYLALVRPGWCLALAFIIFACMFGYSGPINWFLSMPIFEILSKLTYAIYLTHYTIIYMNIAPMRTTPRFSPDQTLHLFWGDFMFTCFVALLLSLAFEFPIVALEGLLFRGSKKK